MKLDIEQKTKKNKFAIGDFVKILIKEHEDKPNELIIGHVVGIKELTSVLYSVTYSLISTVGETYFQTKDFEESKLEFYEKPQITKMVNKIDDLF